MGQYFKTVVKSQDGEFKVYSGKVIVNGKTETEGAKLMEHSWWYNYFVNGICAEIYARKDKSRAAWMGDYASSDYEEAEGSYNGLSYDQIKELCVKCRKKGCAVTASDFNLAGLYLINYTKKQYVDCSLYYKNSLMDADWCIHPLPILTCIGNDYGGGTLDEVSDDTTKEFIGGWAWDEISIADAPPADFTEIKPIFKQEGFYIIQ